MELEVLIGAMLQGEHLDLVSMIVFTVMYAVIELVKYYTRTKKSKNGAGHATRDDIKSMTNKFQEQIQTLTKKFDDFIVDAKADKTEQWNKIDRTAEEGAELRGEVKGLSTIVTTLLKSLK